MGKPKMLLPWGDTSILGHLIEQWRRLDADQVMVVCAASDRALQDELARLVGRSKSWICNPAPQRGMFSSIQCAARWAGWNVNLTHWIIALGDQPHLREETLRSLIQFGAGHPSKICQPSYQGHPRHPVLLPKAHFLRLRKTRASSLKEYLQANHRDVDYVQIDDAGLGIDIDQPADYAKAIQICLKTNPGA
jgi:molybdenum cofactor cytidylyltransferase